ncbi:MAG: Shedu immune nuclease family protein [Nocardioides sp.]
MEFEAYRSQAGRVQVKAMVARKAGTIRQMKFERVPANEDADKLGSLFTLDRDGSQAFVEFIKSLEYIPVDSTSDGFHLGEQLLRDIFQDPAAIPSLYRRDPEQFRALIRDDSTAEDLVALARRREVVTKFRAWLNDDAVFRQASEQAGGPEKAWQDFFEENPWVLGVGLGGNLSTSWDDHRLEQIVGGSTVENPGKRVDALLKTQGRISTMVLAEIKHHQHSLVTSQQYRPGCWGPSKELAGGIVQAQQTAYRATKDLSERLADHSNDGVELPEGTFIIRPRSYLIIGSLTEMKGEHGGDHREKFRSFQLYRRNLYEPEVLTFDEVLARAEWQVLQLEGSH